MAWVYVSDAGADQVACASLIEQAAGANEIVFTQRCLKHQVQIAVRQSLALVDVPISQFGLDVGGKYWSVVTKTMHCMRATDKHKQILGLWGEKFGCFEAIRFASRRPPKPITGRWHSIDKCEAMLVAPPPGRYASVLATALVRAPGPKQKHQKQLHATMV